MQNDAKGEILGREETTEELLQIADAIKELTLKKRRVERKRQPLQEEYSEIAYAVYMNVCEASDEKGKLKYTNEDRRRHEVNHRLRNDNKAINLKAKMHEYDDEVDEIVAEINRLQDKKLTLLVSLGAPLPEDAMEQKDKYMV